MGKRKNKLAATALLLTVIALEGYAVLAAEVTAIRQTIPFVGSGTDTVSIIIAAVLMPLAFGYHAGGRFRPGLRNGRVHSVRDKLVFNILIAQLILAVGLSYYALMAFFSGLLALGITHRLVLTAFYALLFLVTPVFLLGQTIPLVGQYMRRERLPRTTGLVLFISTLGSFLGAVLTTLVLMSHIGVHYTTVFIIAVLALPVLLLSRRMTMRALHRSDTLLYTTGIVLFAWAINSAPVMHRLNIVEDNRYNTIAVFEDAVGNRHMIQNNSASSRYNDKGERHLYIEFVERQVIQSILNAVPPRDILVIGAGAFTFGDQDDTNRYDYVDIDSSLQRIAEDYILRKKLGANKTFHRVEARAFLAGTDKKYDVIFLDAYNGDLTLPEHLVTREFYQQVRDHLKDGGIVAANLIVAPGFNNRFSRSIDDTFRSVFPYVSRTSITGDYNLWSDNPDALANVIYFYRQTPDDDRKTIYTDDRNRVFLDKPQVR